jgi:PAS domain S-box-containing protein
MDVPISLNRIAALEGAEKMNVLLVDDTPANLVALRGLLETPDRQLLTAASGEEALKCLLDTDVAAIVLDIHMPGLDGFETAKLIRARERTRDVPILFLTAHRKEQADISLGYACGAVDYMTKPVDPQALRSKITCFIELAKKTAALRRKNAELEQAQKDLIRTKAVAILVKHAPDPLFVSDLHGTVLHANDAACDLLGFEAQDLLHQQVSRFLTAEDTSRFQSVLHDVIQHGITRNVRLNPRTVTGDAIPAVLNASALRDTDGKVLGAIGILRDMRAFEKVLQDLEESRAALLDKITDLEKFEDAVIGRELAMIAMRKELDHLQAEVARLQRPEKG